MKTKNGYFHMNVAELLDTVFAVYKATFLPQLLRVIIIGAMSMALVFAALFVFVLLSLTYYSFDYSAFSVFITILAILALTALVLALNSAAGCYISAAGYRKRKFKIADVRSSVIHGCGRLFTAYFFSFILYVPIALFIRLMLFIFDAINQPNIPEGSFLLSTWFAAVYLIVFIVVITGGFILVQTLSACIAGAALFEKKRFFSAFARSLELTKGCRLKIAASLTLWYLVSFVMNYSITVLLSLPTVLQNIIAGTASSYALLSGAALMLQYISIMLTALLMAPFRDILSILIFYNQKIKKEGYNITLELEQPDDTL